ELAVLKRRQSFFPAPHRCDGIALVFEHATERLANSRLVIHHEDAVRLHALREAGRTASAGLPGSALSGSAGTGISTVNRAPAGRLSSTRIRALCSARM